MVFFIVRERHVLPKAADSGGVSPILSIDIAAPGGQRRKDDDHQQYGSSLDILMACGFLHIYCRLGFGGRFCPLKQLIQRQIQCCRQRLQQRDLGESQSPLPLGHGGVADVQLSGKLLLSQAFFLSRRCNERAGLLQIHGLPSRLSV